MNNTFALMNTNYSLSELIDRSGEKFKADMLALLIWFMEG